jgi:aspartate/methionine/tyrosine aminotransferase
MGMFIALFTCLNPGDEVLIPDPCFPVYTEQIRMCRGKAVSVPTYEEERFRFNPARAREYVTDKTKALIINTPNNPTGACMCREDMQEIADFAEEFDLLVIADDIYTSMSYEAPFMPFMSLPGMRERTITINSASKDFVMTGYRIGWTVSPAHLADAMRKANDVMVFTAPAPSQRAALYALKHRHDVMPPVLEEFRKRVFKAAELIQSIPKLSVLPPMGTFYLFVNIKETGLTSEEFAYKVLEDAHVLMLSGTAFGAAGEGYVRIACTRSIEDLTEAMERIRRIGF